MNIVGAVRGLAIRYGALNDAGLSIHEGVHSASNLGWIIQVKGAMNALGASLDGEAS